MARVFPVLEIRPPPDDFWLPIPRARWPLFIALRATASHEEVLQGDRRACDVWPPGRARHLRRGVAGGFPPIAPGGLAVSDGVTTIHPSCCCGLEDWLEWRALLHGGSSPWLGHDPAPWVEASREDFVVWSDGGMSVEERGVVAVRLSRAELAAGLAECDAALHGFADRIAQVLGDYGVVEAGALRNAFRGSFIEPIRTA